MINHLRRINIINFSFGERKGCPQCSILLPVFLRVTGVWHVDETVRKVIKLKKTWDPLQKLWSTSQREHGIKESDAEQTLEFKSWLHWSALTGLWGIYFPCGSDGKEPAHNAGDLGLIPGLGRPLEKEMATHSSILAWKSTWREETGGIQSVTSQRPWTWLGNWHLHFIWLHCEFLRWT